MFASSARISKLIICCLILLFVHSCRSGILWSSPPPPPPPGPPKIPYLPQKQMELLCKQIAKEIPDIHRLGYFGANWKYKPEQAISMRSCNCKVEGMAGLYPDTICFWIKKLTTSTASPEKRTIPLKHRLLLYGPPGNGKTTLATVIAHLTKRKLIDVGAPALVGSYIGESARNISEFFQAATMHTESTNEGVVVFIDEIDAIAADNSHEMRTEHKAALQQLWLELDKCAHNPKIFVLFATNCFEKLHNTFTSRFSNYNKAEIVNPDGEMRKNIIQYAISQYEFDAKLQSTQLDLLITDTEGFSIRQLLELFVSAAVVAENNNKGILTIDIIKRELAIAQQANAENASTEQYETILKKVEELHRLLALQKLIKEF